MTPKPTGKFKTSVPLTEGMGWDQDRGELLWFDLRREVSEGKKFGPLEQSISVSVFT